MRGRVKDARLARSFRLVHLLVKVEGAAHNLFFFLFGSVVTLAEKCLGAAAPVQALYMKAFERSIVRRTYTEVGDMIRTV